MAAEVNALQSYDVPTNREDLSNVMTIIAQEETPFVSMVPTVDATATLHEWPEEDLSAASDTPIPEANTTTRTQVQSPVRRRNICMIREREATVSGTQQACDPAGIEDHMDHAVALKLREIKRDIEKCAVGSSRPLILGAAAGTARQARSFPHFITTNLAGGWVAAVDDLSASTPGVAAAFTEANVLTGMRKAWQSGQVPDKMLVNPAHLEVVGAFVGRVNSTHDVAEKAVNLFYVEIIKTPYGALTAMPDPQMPVVTTMYALGVSPKFAAIAWLRKIGSVALGKIGDYETKLVNGEFTIEVKSEKAHWLAGNLS